VSVTIRNLRKKQTKNYNCHCNDKTIAMIRPKLHARRIYFLFFIIWTPFDPDATARKVSAQLPFSGGLFSSFFLLFLSLSVAAPNKLLQKCSFPSALVGNPRLTENFSPPSPQLFPAFPPSPAVMGNWSN